MYFFYIWLRSHGMFKKWSWKKLIGFKFQIFLLTLSENFKIVEKMAKISKDAFYTKKPHNFGLWDHNDEKNA